MSWTEERVELLKTMWTEGKSASQIAKALGGVTRNAVIGKVHRLGLSNRNNGAAEKDEPRSAAAAEPPESAEPAAAQAPAPAAEPAPAGRDAAPPRPAPAAAAAPAAAQNAAPPAAPASEISPEALANLAEVEKRARRLTLMQLTERTCKWPIGDPATDDFWFCGLPSEPGKPYCEAHVAVAFQPMSSRRDRRAGGR